MQPTYENKILELEKERDAKLDEARIGIRQAMKQRGPYRHNIIGCWLRDVAKSHGNEVANGLIDEFDIERKIGIRKEPRK